MSTTSPSHRPAFLPMFLALAYVVLVISLELVQINAISETANRTIGVLVGDEETSGLTVARLTEGHPAEIAGIEVGDRLLRVDGQVVATYQEFMVVCDTFERGQSVPFVVERQGETLTLSVIPGVDPVWWIYWVSVFVVAACLTLGLLALYQKGWDLRARLVAAFSFLLAVELALPPGPMGDVRLQTLSYSLFLLVTGVQMAVELHLACVVPSRHRWIEGRPWLVPLFYVLGFGAGGLAWLTFLLERSPNATVSLPWTFDQTEGLLFNILMPVWALAVPVLLGASAFKYAQGLEKTQARLIFLGILPWTIYVMVGLALAWMNIPAPSWLDAIFPLVVLGFPASVAVSIYRFELFDIELVVRRSFFYTALTGAMIAFFYLAVGTLGLVSSKATGDNVLSIWTVSGAMFIVGLGFNILRTNLQRIIDRALFPEHQALRRRLAELASELPAQGNVTGMGQHLVQRLSDIYGLQAASLLLSDPKSGLFFTVASTNTQADKDLFSLSFLVKPDDPVMRKLAEVGHPVPASKMLSASPVWSRRLKALDAQLMVPLHSHSSLVGVLVLGRRQGRGRFSREDRDLLHLIGHQIATTFENIRLFESATFESLTGLRRRESILELLSTEIDRAKRYGRPLVVGMADLDFFKSVNDQFGHLAGDAVLKRVAEVLTSGLRSTDAVGRYGGEEFLLVFPETQLEGGASVAEKLRVLVERLSLPMDDGSFVDPKISIGLAELSNVDHDSEDLVRSLIENADRALYEAKASGRNQVKLYSLSGELSSSA